MKTAASVALLALGATAAVDETQFNAWKKQYGKSYLGSEHNARFGIFQANAKFVEDHNSQNLSWTVGLNEFADMTNEEFTRERLGTRPTSFGTSGGRVHKPLGAVPASVDWRTNSSVVGPVKNQGSCGSCWAFSTIVSVEGQAGLKSGKYTSLSEQQLVDCVKGEGTSYDPAKCCDGCQGGLMDNAFAYVVEKQQGVFNSETAYPYKGQNGNCAFDASNAAANITGYTDCRPGSATPKAATAAEEDNVRDAVANVGPVSIAVDAGGLGWQLYFGGIHNCKAGLSDPAKADHGVALVGYGVQNDKQYWTIRNSWGGSWGEKGYMRVNYGGNACGVANFASYPNL